MGSDRRERERDVERLTGLPLRHVLTLYICIYLLWIKVYQLKYLIRATSGNITLPRTINVTAQTCEPTNNNNGCCRALVCSANTSNRPSSLRSYCSRLIAGSHPLSCHHVVTASDVVVVVCHLIRLRCNRTSPVLHRWLEQWLPSHHCLCNCGPLTRSHCTNKWQAYCVPVLTVWLLYCYYW